MDFKKKRKKILIVLIIAILLGTFFFLEYYFDFLEFQNSSGENSKNSGNINLKILPPSDN
jgi:heme/copper-type cytochrome/quinol oxidase subunit 3